MISFRYHIVTIVAVFLALAVGILLGGTVFDTGLAKTLNVQVRDLQSSVNQYRTTIADLEKTASTWQRYGQGTRAELVANRLAGRSVLLVTDPTVDLSAFNMAQQALREAGATVVGVVQVTAKMALPDDTARQDLATVLSVPPTSSGTALSREATRALATRLVHVPDPSEPDLLEGLSGAGFVSVLEAPDGVAGIGGSDQAVVVMAGGGHEARVAPDAFLLPLMQAIAQDDPQMPVVAAEPTVTVYPFVSLVRAGTLDGRVSTVDDLDTVFGQVALVGVLARLAANPSQEGNYGLKDGVDLLPAFP